MENAGAAGPGQPLALVRGVSVRGFLGGCRVEGLPFAYAALFCQNSLGPECWAVLPCPQAAPPELEAKEEAEPHGLLSVLSLPAHSVSPFSHPCPMALAEFRLEQGLTWVCGPHRVLLVAAKPARPSITMATDLMTTWTSPAAGFSSCLTRCVSWFLACPAVTPLCSLHRDSDQETVLVVVGQSVTLGKCCSLSFRFSSEK